MKVIFFSNFLNRFSLIFAIFLFYTFGFVACSKVLSEKGYSIAAEDLPPPPIIQENDLIISDEAKKTCEGYDYPTDFCLYEKVESQSVQIKVSPSSGVLTDFSVNLSEDRTNGWHLDSTQCPHQLSETCTLMLEYSPLQSTESNEKKSVTLHFNYTNNISHSVEKKQSYFYSVKRIQTKNSGYSLSNLGYSSNDMIAKISVIKNNYFALIAEKFYNSSAIDYNTNSIVMKKNDFSAVNYFDKQFKLTGKIILRTKLSSNSFDYSSFDPNDGSLNKYGNTDYTIIDRAIGEKNSYACSYYGDIYRMNDQTKFSSNISGTLFLSQCLLDESDANDVLYVFAQKNIGDNKTYLYKYRISDNKSSIICEADNGGEFGNNFHNSLITSKDKIFIVSGNKIQAYVIKGKSIVKLDTFKHRVNVSTDQPIVNEYAIYYPPKNELYFLTKDNKLHSISADTGNENWSINIPSSSNSPLFLSKSGGLIVPSVDGNIYIIKPKKPNLKIDKNSITEYFLNVNIVPSLASMEESEYLVHIPAVGESGLIGVYSIHVDW